MRSHKSIFAILFIVLMLITSTSVQAAVPNCNRCGNPMSYTSSYYEYSSYNSSQHNKFLVMRYKCSSCYTITDVRLSTVIIENHSCSEQYGAYHQSNQDHYYKYDKCDCGYTGNEEEFLVVPCNGGSNCCSLSINCTHPEIN